MSRGQAKLAEALSEAEGVSGALAEAEPAPSLSEGRDQREAIAPWRGGRNRSEQIVLWLRTSQTRLLGFTPFRLVRCARDDNQGTALEADRDRVSPLPAALRPPSVISPVSEEPTKSRQFRP